LQKDFKIFYMYENRTKVIEGKCFSRLKNSRKRDLISKEGYMSFSFRLQTKGIEKDDETKETYAQVHRRPMRLNTS